VNRNPQVRNEKLGGFFSRDFSLPENTAAAVKNPNPDNR